MVALMVEFATVGSAARFSVIARPNSVTRKSGLVVTLAILLPVCTLVGAGFLALGAWPVTIYMLLAVVALVAAFLHVERHAEDFERLTLDGDRLILDWHSPGEDRHLEFNSHWVQVELQPVAARPGNRLALRSHGRAIPFGQLLSDNERVALGLELRHRLAQTRT
jgi:uncharacterized membrane protein